MVSRSFFNGMARGLLAPGGLFAPQQVRRSRRFDASIDRAWRDVGVALGGALSEEGARIDKEAGNDTATRRAHPAAAE
jgi:hypothetical protein